eukprot:GDKI01030008.1.p1 GENE.GDKI01030008.1~~GDKI01030008.1.p1  ORF type:complete len:431 (-),score=67.04 GDKI01030008.1:194-1486(-)
MAAVLKGLLCLLLVSFILAQAQALVVLYISDSVCSALAGFGFYPRISLETHSLLQNLLPNEQKSKAEIEFIFHCWGNRRIGTCYIPPDGRNFYPGNEWEDYILPIETSRCTTVPETVHEWVGTTDTHPDVVVIALGANDRKSYFWANGTADIRDIYAHATRDAVASVREQWGGAHILIIPPLPIDMSAMAANQFISELHWGIETEIGKTDTNADTKTDKTEGLSVRDVYIRDTLTLAIEEARVNMSVPMSNTPSTDSSSASGVIENSDSHAVVIDYWQDNGWVGEPSETKEGMHYQGDVTAGRYAAAVSARVARLLCVSVTGVRNGLCNEEPSGSVNSQEILSRDFLPTHTLQNPFDFPLKISNVLPAPSTNDRPWPVCVVDVSLPVGESATSTQRECGSDTTDSGGGRLVDVGIVGIWWIIACVCMFFV